MHQPRCGLSSEPFESVSGPHRQRIYHDVRRHPRLDRPAHDFSIEQINDNGQVFESVSGQPALVRPDIGHVRCPDLIRCRRRKVSVQQVLRYRQRMFGIGRRLVAPLVPRPDAVLSHQTFHPRLARRKASLTHPGHARTAVGTFQFGMNSPDQRQHLNIRQPLAFPFATAFPGPVTTDADRQYVAHHGQRPSFALGVNPGVLFEPVSGHSASFAKYAVAFFIFLISRLPS